MLLGCGQIFRIRIIVLAQTIALIQAIKFPRSHKKGPMGGALYIRFKQEGGLTFEVSNAVRDITG